MSQLLFEKSLQKLKVFFKYSGLILDIGSPNKLRHRLLFTFNFLWVLSAIVASVMYIIVGISEGMNLTQLTSVAPCIAFSILSVVKSFFHVKHEADVQTLIENLKELERTEKMDSVEKRNIIEEETKFLHLVLNVLFLLNCSMIVVFDLSPLLLISVKYYKTGEFEMLLPYLDVFLYIPHEFGFWVFAYIHQIWSEVVVLLEMGASDCLFFVYCTYIRVHFRLLQQDLEKVISRKKTAGEETKFNLLVKRHQRLITSSQILEDIYSKSMLCNFLSSSVVICLTGFNVTVVNDPVVVVTFITFLLMGLMQVFLLCFFADMMRSSVMLTYFNNYPVFVIYPREDYLLLEDLLILAVCLILQSEEVCNAVYNCRWYARDRNFGRKVLVVQIRTLEPCKLTAAGFADVNLRAFMRVLSTSWSYFALLQTLYRE